MIDEALARKIPFALGGAFALAAYTGCWRDTKDIDLYVLPHFRDQMLQVLHSFGFEDYYAQMPYDRWWIYRSTAEGTIVDVIWAMANHRSEIDELWMAGPTVEIHQRILRVLPPEALIWDKLFILQRDRCDWPDIMNLLLYAGPQVDWRLLTARLGEDRPLLAAALTVFRWLAPGRAEALPPWLWDQLDLPARQPGPLPETIERRISLLDTRPWFGRGRQGVHRPQEDSPC